VRACVRVRARARARACVCVGGVVNEGAQFLMQQKY